MCKRLYTCDLFHGDIRELSLLLSNLQPFPAPSQEKEMSFAVQRLLDYIWLVIDLKDQQRNHLKCGLSCQSTVKTCPA